MTAQQLQTEKLRMGSFNELDGPRVAGLLADHADLWEGYVFGRFQYWPLIELREIQAGVSADTLYLQPKPGKADELFALCHQFCADAVDFVNGEEAGELMGTYTQVLARNPKALIRVWWD